MKFRIAAEYDAKAVILLALYFLVFIPASDAAKGRRGKGNKKNLLPFPQITDYSLIPKHDVVEGGATITKASHFHQIYRLGYKLILICESEGTPPPDIKWYRDGNDLDMKNSMHLTHTQLSANKVKSRLEIDPATVGDQGTYTCIANNKRAAMAKSFKAEYTY